MQREVWRSVLLLGERLQMSGFEARGSGLERVFLRARRAHSAEAHLMLHTAAL